MSKSAELLTELINQNISQSFLKRYKLVDKSTIVGVFTSKRRDFQFKLTRKGLAYKPLGVNTVKTDSFGNFIKRATAHLLKCTEGKSYECGQTCIPELHHCWIGNKAVEDIEKVKNIFNAATEELNNFLSEKKKSKKAAIAQKNQEIIKAQKEQNTKKDVATAQKKTEQKTSPPPFQGHVVSGNSRYNDEAIAKAFDAITSPNAKERIDALHKIIAKQGIQVVFNDGSISKQELTQKVAYKTESLKDFQKKIEERKEIVKKLEKQGKKDAVENASKIIANAEKKIGDNFVEMTQQTNGFTSSSFNHVVVNTKKTDSPFTVTKKDIDLALDTVYKKSEINPDDLWSVSTTLRDKSQPSDGGSFITYLHELGHQIDFLSTHASGEKSSATNKNATKYSKTNDQEWFAEHFALWFLDAERYQKFDPEGAKIIESRFNLARSASKRL